MIKLTSVSVEFDSGVEHVFALDRVNLSITPGEFVVLQGASGSGKSTLLNVIAGLERVSHGTVEVDEVAVDSATERSLAQMRLTRVGVIFQENNLIAEFSAIENVKFPLRARGLSASEAHAEASRSLAAVGIEELGRRRPSQLSGGQKQRVGIARAIAGGKTYLLADEPTGALDSKTSIQIFAMMRHLADDGYGIIVASHDPRVAQWADRALELVDGTFAPDPVTITRAAAAHG